MSPRCVSERAGKIRQTCQGNFQLIDQIGRKLGRILEHVFVLLDILAHHGDLLARLLNSLLILFDRVAELFHVGDAIQQLNEVRAAIRAGNGEGMRGGS